MLSSCLNVKSNIGMSGNEVEQYDPSPPNLYRFFLSRVIAVVSPGLSFTITLNAVTPPCHYVFPTESKKKMSFDCQYSLKFSKKK